MKKPFSPFAPSFEDPTTNVSLLISVTFLFASYTFVVLPPTLLIVNIDGVM